jgi:hypothetical protein
MKELDKLVENYFIEKKAPELGMDMLLEMVEQSLEEAIYYDKDGYGVVDHGGSRSWSIRSRASCRMIL